MSHRTETRVETPKKKSKSYHILASHSCLRPPDPPLKLLRRLLLHLLVLARLILILEVLVRADCST